jgi:hypothetical protein
MLQRNISHTQQLLLPSSSSSSPSPILHSPFTEARDASLQIRQKRLIHVHEHVDVPKEGICGVERDDAHRRVAREEPERVGVGLFESGETAEVGAFGRDELFEEGLELLRIGCRVLGTKGGGRTRKGSRLST